MSLSFPFFRFNYSASFIFFFCRSFYSPYFLPFFSFYRSRWLMGGPVPYRPATATAEWAEIAPRLAGLPPGTDEQFITLLTTGIARTGRPPRPPMPQFRMTRQDAQRVLAYLKSVKPSE
jgi:hypothetical protein